MKEFTMIRPCEPGKSVTKIISASGEKISDYSLGEYVQFRIVKWSDFHTGIKLVLSDRKHLLILGELTEAGLKEHKDGVASRRLKKKRGESEPTIQDRDGCELILDIDSIPIEGFDPLKPGPGIRGWLENVGIGSVACTWQITSSQKLGTNEARIRLYIELDGEYSLADRKKYVKSIGCDPSIYTCTQPIYTARPQVVGGSDFIPNRVGFLSGERETISLPDVAPTTKEKPNNPVESDFSVDSAFDDVETSSDYHAALRGIALSQANKRLSVREIYSSLRGVLLLVDEKYRDERWYERFDDKHLMDLAQSAVDIVKDDRAFGEVDDLPEIDIDAYNTKEMSYPPGLLGKMCREAYEMQHHPNRTIAIMASFALVAGIVGRKYNINGTGLNLYISLLMDTGQGKKSITDIIDKVLMLSEDCMSAPSFKGKQSFTGAKPLFDMLANTGMSKVCIMTEAGLLNQKSSGDQAGLIRAILDLYTKSGADDFAGDEGYSSTENNIPLLRAVALTLIQESTPDSFIESLASRNSERSGELARMWIMRFSGDKKYLNRKRRTKFSPDIMKRLNELMKYCSTEQGIGSEDLTSRPKVTEIPLPDWAWEYADHWVDKENEFKSQGKHLNQVMCTRAFLKAMKIMSVAAVFNSPTTDSITIEEDVFKWVDQQPIRLEMEGIIDLMTRESSNDVMAVVKQVMMPTIIKILQNKYNSTTKVPRKELRDRGIFTHSNIAQCLSNNSVLRGMTTNTFTVKDGVTKLIDYMVDSGLLFKVPDSELPARVKKGYQITMDFEALAKMAYEKKRKRK